MAYQPISIPCSSFPMMDLYHTWSCKKSIAHRLGVQIVLAHNPGTYNGHHKPLALINIKLRNRKPQVKFQTKGEMSWSWWPMTMLVILSRKTMTIEIGITGNHELSFDPSLRGLEHELSATMGRCGHTGNCDCLGPIPKYTIHFQKN